MASCLRRSTYGPRGPECHHLSRRADRHEVPAGAAVGCRPTEPYRLPVAGACGGRLPADREIRLEAMYPIIEGYKDSVAFGGSCAIQRSAWLRLAEPDAQLQPDSRPPVEGTGCTRRRLAALPLVGRAEVERRRLLRPVRSDQAQPRGLQRLRRVRAAAALRSTRDTQSRQQDRLFRRSRRVARVPERGVVRPTSSARPNWGS